MDCVDNEGLYIKDGERFYPRADDYCLSCVCLNGTEQMCLSAACAPPTNCVRFEKVERTCCTYTCTKQTVHGYGADALSTAGIRLAATIATCILAIVILLLIMHKLRRHRLLLRIRQGMTGSGGRTDSSVMYSTEYDAVDIDISYQPLHVPGAPPPYSPSFDDAPPAYSAVAAPATNNSTVIIQANGMVNAGCQATPPESMYNICGADAKPKSVTDSSKTAERGCGVGASYTDLALSVDLSDSCNDMRSHNDVYSELSSSAGNLENGDNIHTQRTDGEVKGTGARREPLGGELSPKSTSLMATPVTLRIPHNSVNRDSASASMQNVMMSPYSVTPVHTVTSPTYSMTSPYADTLLREGRKRVRKAGGTRSADSSPTVLKRYSDSTRRMTMTDYGFVDDKQVEISVGKARGQVVGLREDQLLSIASKKPDRLNARVRRQRRLQEVNSNSSIS